MKATFIRPFGAIVALLIVLSASAELRAERVRGFLGVKGEDSTSGPPGVIVTDVYPGSPAALARIQRGDRIGSVNGRPVSSLAELGRMTAAAPGTTFRLSVSRGDRARDVTVTLVEAPAELRPPDGGDVKPPAPRSATEGAHSRDQR